MNGKGAVALLVSVTLIVVETVEVPGGTIVALAVTEAEIGSPTSKSVCDDWPGKGLPSLVSNETWRVYTPFASPAVEIWPRLRPRSPAPGTRLTAICVGVPTTAPAVSRISTWARRFLVALAALKTSADAAIGWPAFTVNGVAITLRTSAIAGRMVTTAEVTWLTTDSAAVTWSVKIVDDWMFGVSVMPTDSVAPAARDTVLWLSWADAPVGRPPTERFSVSVSLAMLVSLSVKVWFWPGWRSTWEGESVAVNCSAASWLSTPEMLLNRPVTFATRALRSPDFASAIRGWTCEVNVASAGSMASRVFRLPRSVWASANRAGEVAVWSEARVLARSERTDESCGLFAELAAIDACETATVCADRTSRPTTAPVVRGDADGP